MGDGLLVEAGKRLAAVALILVVGTDEEGVDAGAGGFEYLLKAGVDGFNVSEGVEAAGDAALIGDNDYAQTGGIEAAQCLGDARDDAELLPLRDVLVFRHLLVQDSVAVEEDCGKIPRDWLAGRIDHVAMIAT